MNNFQTILVAVFLAFFVFAVLIFSGTIKIGNSSTSTGAEGTVTIWGTFPKDVLTEATDAISSDYKDLVVNYSIKDPSTYQQDLIEAFANGKGPDLFIISPDMIQKNNNFIYKIPYTSYPEKTFTDSFIDGASIYLDKSGVIGYPILVDPIVLYYNKDILSNESIVYPPKTWDELFTMNSFVTKRDDTGKISQSMIALGQYKNINNVKDILATLLLQNNNPIVKAGDSGYISALVDNPQNLSVSPITAVLKFFIEFSNPSDTAYSWNSSLSNSLDMFTGGKLAFYIGRASELFNIEKVNPNLSFNVDQVPQIKNSTTKRTFGEIYAVVINKKTTNLASAILTAGNLSYGTSAKVLSTGMSLPPVAKTLLSDKPTDNPYLFTFFNSAIISKSWPDPDKEKSNSIFKELIENILSNNLSISDAINKAQGELGQIIKK